MADLVVMSLERWDEVWRRNQHLISGLLREDSDLRVLFVEPPVDPVHDLLSGRIPSRGQGVAEVPGVAPGRLWKYRPVKRLPRRLDPGADERLARGVLRAARGLGLARPLLWINDPGAAPLAIASGWHTLYDMTDDWLTADRPASELDRIAAAETYLLENAVEVVACSSELLRRKTPDRPAQRRPITLIPNAVDVAAYRHPAPRPGDLPAGRVAVYVGTLHSDRLDVTLCERTARSLQDAATLVLVGPNGLRREDSARLRSAGVVILGARPRDEVIGYLQHADVLVVPHVVTPFTDSLDPIKLYEYQAAGRRIVSTPVAGFRDVEDPRFTIAGGRAYVDAVLAQVTASESPRTPVSAVPDWGDRVTQMGATLARARSGMNGAPG